MREFGGTEPVFAGDAGQRFALQDAAALGHRLACLQLRRRQALRQKLGGPGRAVQRQAQQVALRHAPAAFPAGRQQRGVQAAQFLAAHVQGVGERAHGHEARHAHFAEARLGLAVDGTEVPFGVAVDGERGEERNVVVARGEAERRAVVATHDADDVIRAQLLLGAPHALGAVVVGGQGQRPGTQQAVVEPQQLRRRLGGAERIHAVVHGRIDAHVATAGGAHELPQARGSGLRVRGGVERGLHVRQHAQLRGHAEVRERLLDVRLPQPRAHQAFAEPVGLAELEAHVLHRAQQPFGRDGGAPQVLDALVLRRQRAGGAGDAAQGRGDVALGGLHQVLALAGGGVRPELQRLVDHAQVVLVVDEAGIGADLGVDTDPEINVPVELRGLREQLVEHARWRGCGGRGGGRRCTGQHGRRHGRRAGRGAPRRCRGGRGRGRGGGRRGCHRRRGRVGAAGLDARRAGRTGLQAQAQQRGDGDAAGEELACRRL